MLAIALASAAAAQPAGIPPLPKPRREALPTAPYGGRYTWQPGAWDWDAADSRYIWHNGRYVVRRPGATRYASGRWVQTGGTWVWQHGRWR